MQGLRDFPRQPLMVPTLDRAHCTCTCRDQSRAEPNCCKRLFHSVETQTLRKSGARSLQRFAECKSHHVRSGFSSYLFSDSTEQQDQVRFTEQKKYCVTKVQRISISPSISSERRSQVVQNRSNDRRAKKGLIRCRKGG